MSRYDNWKSTTPDDELDAAEEAEAAENARFERMIDDLEGGYEPDYDDGPWA